MIVFEKVGTLIYCTSFVLFMIYFIHKCVFFWESWQFTINIFHILSFFQVTAHLFRRNERQMLVSGLQKEESKGKLHYYREIFL